MKNTFAIIIVFVLLSYHVVPAIIFVDFEINQDFIAEFLCVNKDVPGSSCHGQCHLKKEIDKATKSDGEDEPKSFQLRKLVQINCPLINLVFVKEFLKKNILTFFSKGTILSPFVYGVFHPPEK